LITRFPDYAAKHAAMAIPACFLRSKQAIGTLPPDQSTSLQTFAASSQLPREQSSRCRWTATSSANSGRMTALSTTFDANQKP
jgi:hypothetical protein